MIMYGLLVVLVQWQSGAGFVRWLKYRTIKSIFTIPSQIWRSFICWPQVVAWDDIYTRSLS